MNSKNIFIAIGVISIGVILYKLLLGFILPIALFVSLGYVLKFLLKGGSESDSGQEPSEILKNSNTPSSIDNIVEIKPIEENKSSQEESPSQENKSSQEESPSQENKPSQEESPSQENKPSPGDSPSKENSPI